MLVLVPGPRCCPCSQTDSQTQASLVKAGVASGLRHLDDLLGLDLVEAHRHLVGVEHVGFDAVTDPFPDHQEVGGLC